ncbi:GAF domain-containing protein [Nocardioides aurantiacus]|uniref:Histidine kinase/DNA gyrase B/HSP90-like ATPase n=1 Tax=Nocardioides aurantiacus TaxID=86796 RepID=A0A3N2CTI8_9ACTN|nr:GAF domain-containing protein [Nocardioides aurantiacus]ROR90849.1 histidine kinase/DNA gyrase B/HSP90-like ATPase [Nocardioides aurantiacus]
MSPAPDEHAPGEERARLRLLLSAVVSMSADLTLDGVLARIVEIARELTGARYTALGVLDTPPRQGLRTFIHRGMAESQVVEIGHLPTGHGILGLLIDRPEPLRLHDLGAHPESFGFPAGHPPMHSFLGVPVRTRDRVFGNLYLTEKSGGGDFDDLDEDVVVALASAAGVAIENARLYEEAGRRENWLAATAEVTAVLSGADAAGSDSLQVIADRARAAAAADVAWVVVDTDGSLEVRAVSGPRVSPEDLRRLPLEQSLTATVVRGGESITVVDVRRDPRALVPGDLPGWPVLGPAVVVPLRSGRHVEGALALAWSPEHQHLFRIVDPRLPEGFAEQAALAMTVLRAREAHQRLSLFEDRDRIGRDLHDLVIQRLFAVGLSLQSVVPLAGSPRVRERLEQAIRDLDATIGDIRRSIFDLGAGQGAGDIQTEITGLVDRAATTLQFRPRLMLTGPLRTVVDHQLAPHLLAVLSEALSNAVRHSGARSISVEVTAGEQLDLVVSDTGTGIPATASESGLGNMRERAAQLGGSCRVESSPQGTVVTWSVPLR